MTSREYAEWRRRAIHARLVALGGLRRIKEELRYRAADKKASLLEHPTVAKAIALLGLYFEAGCQDQLPNDGLLDATENFLVEAQELVK